MEKTVNFCIAEIKFYGDIRMPIAVLKTDDEFQHTVGFLSPFRNYCFQVSDTFKGEGDSGSTPVMGLQNIIGMKAPDTHQPCNLTWNETIEYTMKALATMACIERQGRQFYNAKNDYGAESFVSLRYVDKRAKDEQEILSDGRKSRKWLPTMMDNFILETLRYLGYENYKDLTEEVESK